MEDNQKYNKRPRSRTEFRSSYSDNKKIFDSMDRASRKQFVLKIFFVALIFIGIAIAGFLVTDALLTISEEPYNPAEITTQDSSKTDIDEKYFENQVTVPADKVDEDGNNSDVRE